MTGLDATLLIEQAGGNRLAARRCSTAHQDAGLEAHQAVYRDSFLGALQNDMPCQQHFA